MPRVDLARIADRVLIAAAAVEVLAALAVLFAGGLTDAPPLSPPGALAAQMVAFGVTGMALATLAGGSRRTESLGVAFLLIATAFAHPALASPAASSFAGTLARLPLDALLPYYLWSFVARFPERVLTDRADRVATAFRWSSLAIGVLLALVNSATSDATFARASVESWYGPIVYGLTLLAIPMLAWRLRYTPADERRRVHLFGFGIVVPGGIVIAIVLSTAIAPVAQFVAHPAARYSLVPIVQLLLASVPIVTSYAVLIDRALPLRVEVGVRLGYWFGRALSMLLVALPAALLVYFAVLFRDMPLDALAQSPRGATILVLAVVAFLAVRFHRAIRGALDRAFRREAYDFGTAIATLSTRLHAATALAEVAEAARSALVDTLHVRDVHLLVRAPDGQLTDPGDALGDLEPAHPIAEALRQRAVLDAPDLARQAGEPGMQWLQDGNVALLARIPDPQGWPLGALIVGAKLSELPFSHVDRDLLRAVAESVAPHLQRIEPPAATDPPTLIADWQVATECPNCRRVLPGETKTCPSCRLPTDVLPIPALVAGAYSRPNGSVIPRQSGH